jgi:pyrroloquinoline quinone biosynthesis protein B
MHIVILGSGAGGGLPQWNCGCRNCDAARAGRIPAMSQSGIAVSANGRDWALVNASPDLRQQLAASAHLRPQRLRGSPIHSVLLSNGDIDHVAGLLTLREGQPFDLYATPAIHAALAANPMLAALDPRLVTRRDVALEQPFALAPDLTAKLFAVPGKVPLYLEGETVETELMGEQTVGVELTANRRQVLYIPGCAAVPDWLRRRVCGADALLFDGTLWSDDEMLREGLGRKTGRRMGHVPVSGPGGSLETLRDVAPSTRIYVHLNNSNPLVDPASPERAIAEAAGWQVARDGMEIVP